MNYPVVLDVWEGQLEVDEAELIRGGVKGLIIRLNDMNGGHHMDTGFEAQWKQAGEAGFLRAPYFVYNPWDSGAENFEWLKAHCPATHTICIDVEVRKEGYAATSYASQFAAFMGRAQQTWAHVVTYTGGWFVPYLSYWPTTCQYWWARYPSVMYPAARESWSWDKLHTMLNGLVWPAFSAPGRVTLWQCSGDRIILPGTVRAVDINIFNGTADELSAWFGAEAPTPAISDAEKLARLWNAHPELH